MTDWAGRMSLAYKEPGRLIPDERDKLGSAFDAAWPRHSEQEWRNIHLPNCPKDDLAVRLSKLFVAQFQRLCKHPDITGAKVIKPPFTAATWRIVGNLHVGEGPIDYIDAHGNTRPFLIDFGAVAKAEVFVRIEFESACSA